MTQFIRIIVKSLLLQVLLLSTNLWAKPVGLVKSISGRAFVFHQGNVRELKEGMSIEDFSSVSTELGSQLSISDYFDRTYHLSGSGNLSFMKNLLELKSGYLWIQAPSENKKVILKTSNSQLVFSKAEGVVSYDPQTEKTQVLTISGHFDFANIERSNISERVQSGMFSFIDKQYESGTPRRSTPVGKKSYIKIVSLFSGIEPLEKNNFLGGKVVTYEADHNVSKKGRFLASSTPLAVKPNLSNSKELIAKEFNKLKKKQGKSKLPTYPVKINVYWPSHVKKSAINKSPSSMNRLPASVPTNLKKVDNNTFQNDLVKEYKNQQKYNKDLKNLINELDSYKEDYNTNY